MRSVKRSKVRVAMLLAAGCLVGLLILPGIAYAQDGIEGEPPMGVGIEVGDAPTSWNNHGNASMTAYPGVLANFPVVASVSAPDGWGMCHCRGLSYLGPHVDIGPMPSKSFEPDADTGMDIDGPNNIWPPTDTADRDGHDDGVTFPSGLPHCTPVEILVEGYTIPDEPAFVQVWADWNRDGDWNDESVCGCGDSEYAYRDFPVQGGLPNGYFSATIPIVPCHPVSMTAPLWVRVTLSPVPFTEVSEEWWAGGLTAVEQSHLYNCWDGLWCVGDGETEDYYVEFEPEFVPEWGSVTLLGSGLAGLAGYATLRWRKRRSDLPEV